MNALRRTLTIALTVATLGLGALSTAPDASAHGFFHGGRGGHGGGFHHGFGRVGHRFGWEPPPLRLGVWTSLGIRAPLGPLGRLSRRRRSACLPSGRASRPSGRAVLAKSWIISSNDGSPNRSAAFFRTAGRPRICSHLPPSPTHRGEFKCAPWFSAPSSPRRSYASRWRWSVRSAIPDLPTPCRPNKLRRAAPTRMRLPTPDKSSSTRSRFKIFSPRKMRSVRLSRRFQKTKPTPPIRKFKPRSTRPPSITASRIMVNTTTSPTTLPSSSKGLIEKKTFVGHDVIVKRQIDAIGADDKLSPKEKRAQIKELKETLRSIEPVKYPDNITIVAKYYDKLSEIFDSEE